MYNLSTLKVSYDCNLTQSDEQSPFNFVNPIIIQMNVKVIRELYF
jgi:hypothetical protein